MINNILSNLTSISNLISKTWSEDVSNFNDTTRENCKYLAKIADSNKYFVKIYQTAGLIVLILGLFGNGLGAYLILATEHRSSLKHKIFLGNPGKTNALKRIFKYRKSQGDVNFNIYFMKWFYLVNIFNDLTLILSPVMEYFGAQDLAHKKFWYGRAWIHYHAHFHNPIVKPFVVWGFLIYVQYFGSKMVAVKFPFKYKIWMTLRNVRMSMLVALVYSVMWYLPTIKWREMIKARECDSTNITKMALNSALTMPSYKNLTPVNIPRDYPYLFPVGLFNESESLSKLGEIDQEAGTFYYYIIYSPGEGKYKVMWIAYQIMREMFTKILPFTIIIVSKMVTIFERVQVKSKVLTSTEKKIKSSNQKTKFLEQILSFGDKKVKTNADDNDEVSESINPQDSASSEILKITKIKYGHKLTLYILTVEFVLLMLPVSVIQMIMDLLIPHHDKNKLLYIYCVLNILEFVYISCTFYINFIFNPYYRREIIDLITAKCHSYS
ncbi:unnamed protein product [Gordionus sp. m RMFG-2023]